MVRTDEFYMWRALLAFSVCDNNLSWEEKNILSTHLKTADFSLDQMKILKEDLRHPQDIEGFYKKINNIALQKRFCELARTLVWSDGDISRQEKEILKRVGCFENRDHDWILKESGKSKFIQNYTKKYENIAFMNDNKAHSLFEHSA